MSLARELQEAFRLRLWWAQLAERAVTRRLSYVRDGGRWDDPVSKGLKARWAWAHDHATAYAQEVEALQELDRQRRLEEGA